MSQVQSVKVPVSDVTDVPMQDPVVPACFLYEHINYNGKTLTVTGDIKKFVPLGFNDVASSLVVSKGQWLVCEHIDFGGRSKVFGPGKYPNFVGMGINDIASSIKLIKS